MRWHAVRTALAWAVVAPFLAWAVVRWLGLERGFPLVPLLSFTPLAAAGAIVATALAGALRARLPAVLGAVAAVALLVAVGGRALPKGVGPSAEPGLRVLTANVLRGATPARDLIALARRQRADVLAVQELTPALDAKLRRAFPHHVAAPGPASGGSGIYSRHRLTPRGAPRTAARTVVADLRAPGIGTVRVAAVHPTAPLRAGLMRAWRRDLRALPEASDPGPPLVLAGDFNATLDHAELRRLVGTGYRDAAATTGDGLRGTWPSHRHPLLGVQIDHVLVEAPLRVRGTRVRDLPRSDHRAVSAEVLPPDS